MSLRVGDQKSWVRQTISSSFALLRIRFLLQGIYSKLAFESLYDCSLPWILWLKHILFLIWLNDSMNYVSNIYFQMLVCMQKLLLCQVRNVNSITLMLAAWCSILNKNAFSARESFSTCIPELPPLFIPCGAGDVLEDSDIVLNPLSQEVYFTIGLVVSSGNCSWIKRDTGNLQLVGIYAFPNA